MKVEKKLHWPKGMSTNTPSQKTQRTCSQQAHLVRDIEKVHVHVHV